MDCRVKPGNDRGIDHPAVMDAIAETFVAAARTSTPKNPDRKRRHFVP